MKMKKGLGLVLAATMLMSTCVFANDFRETSSSSVEVTMYVDEDGNQTITAIDGEYVPIEAHSNESVTKALVTNTYTPIYTFGKIDNDIVSVEVISVPQSGAKVDFELRDEDLNYLDGSSSSCGEGDIWSTSKFVTGLLGADNTVLGQATANDGIYSFKITW